MTISYIGQGGAVAVTTTCSPTYPAGIATNDKLVLSVTSDGSAIGTPGVEWTEAGTETAGGGLRARQWTRDYDGSAPTVTVSATSGTKGEAHIVAYRSTLGAMTTVAATVATDTDSTSTAINATGGSWTSVTDDWIAESYAMLAPSGAYTGSATGPAILQAGATVSTTAQFAGRTGTNTVAYGHASGTVTSGGTGAVSFTATGVGANAAGVVPMVLLHEVTPPAIYSMLRPAVVAP